MYKPPKAELRREPAVRSKRIESDREQTEASLTHSGRFVSGHFPFRFLGIQAFRSNLYNPAPVLSLKRKDVFGKSIEVLIQVFDIREGNMLIKTGQG